MVKPFVIGRKAWLFSDTVNGATASAKIFNLVETDKANGQGPTHGCATYSSGWRLLRRSRITKPYCRGTARQRCHSKLFSHHWAGGVYGSHTNDSLRLQLVTTEEAMVCPLRIAQLEKRQAYAVYFAQVTAQDGWPSKMEWSEQPATGLSLPAWLGRTGRLICLGL